MARQTKKTVKGKQEEATTSSKQSSSKAKNNVSVNNDKNNTSSNKSKTFGEEKFNVKSFVRSIVLSIDRLRQGRISSVTFKSLGEHLITQKVNTFDIYNFEPWAFTRRITALKFHPTKHSILAIGDKAGELILRDLQEDEKKIGWTGIGPGGSITSIAFDPFSNDCLLSSSIDGTVQKRNYGIDKSQALLDTGSFEKWYCCVNASSETGLIVTGDTRGVLTILSKQYKTVCNYKLHKGKINSAEFSKSRGWLLATASLDKTVKLWDLRKIEEKSPVLVLPHDHPINAACFSAVDGNRLLTTDQQSELRVYKAPVFELETLIHHPHRQFQHLTPIRACWHPLTDLVVVGRYPDPSWPTYTHGELRTVDVFSAASGEMLTQMYSNSCKGIISLNDFNATGEIMASAMGQYVPYWRARPPRDRLAKDDNPWGGEESDDEDPKLLSKVNPPKRTAVSKRKSKECSKKKNTE